MCIKPAVSDSRAPGELAKQVRQLYLVQAENFNGDSMVVGTNSRGSADKTQVCESCGTVGNGDSLPYSGSLHVGYQ